MKTIVTFFFSLLLLSFYSAPESRGQSRISGRVLEQEGEPLPFVNVLLLQATDSSLVKGMVTDEAGQYLIEQVPEGQYVIAASMVGYKKAYSQTFRIQEPAASLELGTLSLEVDQAVLQEVTVEAKKPLYEQQLDRLVVNVQNSITASGATALEVLERSPGVTVDRQNSSLALGGRQGVQVMVNGRISRLPLQAVLQMLEGMQAATIERIELIPTPPAKYDAEGSAGLINIVLGKNPDFGTNGSFSLSAGHGRFGKASSSLSLNHRTRKLNLYGTLNFSRNHNWYQIGNDRTTLQGEIPTLTTSHSNAPNVHTASNQQLGFDYFLSARTTLSGLVAGSYNRNVEDPRNTITVQEGHHLPTQILLLYRNSTTWRHLMGNLNVKHAITGKQDLSIDLDYLLYHNNNPANYDIRYQFLERQETDQEYIQMGKETPIRIGVAKADYVYRPSAASKLEAGAKGTFTRLDNTVAVDWFRKGSWSRDQEFSQVIDMREDIVAAYAAFEGQLTPQTKLLASLRWEHTYTNLNSPEEKNLVLRRYGNLFPSFFLSRELRPNHSLQLAYGRRITRPTFNNLAPFVVFRDPYSFWTGNTALRPTITDALTGTYQYKKVYLLSLQYSHDQNTINWLVRTNPETNNQNVYIANVDAVNTWSLNLSVPVTVARWWQMQNNLAGFAQESNTLYEGSRLSLRGQYGRINSTQTFKLPHHFNLELTGYYQTPAVFGIFKQTSRGAFGAGIQKKLEKDRGTFNLSISDVFWTDRFRIRLAYPSVNLDQVFYYNPEPRIVRLTYNRTFGNKGVKAVNRRRTASEEERGRVN